MQQLHKARELLSRVFPDKTISVWCEAIRYNLLDSVENKTRYTISIIGSTGVDAQETASSLDAALLEIIIKILDGSLSCETKEEHDNQA